MNNSRKPSKIKQRSVTVLLLRHGERKDEAIQRDMSIEERKRNALLPKDFEAIDSLDPSLTELGYEQAGDAWRNIISAIIHCQHQKRHKNEATRRAQITFVCSPLRRCIGTALMVVSALPIVNVDTVILNHEIPTLSKYHTNKVDGNHVTKEKAMSTSTTLCRDDTSFATTNTSPSTPSRNVPILVLNGLATCAAAIFKFEGVTKTIQHYGYEIPCAVRVNQNGHLPSIKNMFNVTIQSMMDVAKRPFQMTMKSQTEQRSSMSSLLVQYFGVTNYTDGQPNCAMPMSSEITRQLTFRMTTDDNSTITNRISSDSHLDPNIHSTTTTDGVVPDDPDSVRTTSFSTPERERPDTVMKYTTTSRKRIYEKDNYDESFMGALNQAVTIALNNTTNSDNDDDDDALDQYLVVVTHREGIRSLIDHCTRKQNYIRTPYCCIGTFTATTNVAAPRDASRRRPTTPEISYVYHNVSPYENFTL